MEKNRIEYFDMLRGIAIISVIAIHSFSSFGFSSFETINNNSFQYHFAIIYRQIIGCAVPIFLAISGYFLSNKKVDSIKLYFSFLKKQIPRVYIPMLIWSIPYFLLLIYQGKDFFSTLVFFFIGGNSVYYFIILIVQFYLLLPYMQRMANTRSGLIISGIISILCMLFLFYLNNILKVSIPLVLYAGLFPVWIVFFVLGLQFGKKIIIITHHRLLIFTLLGLIVSVAETYLHIYFFGEFKGLGIKTGAFIYSFAIIVLLFSFKQSYTSNSIIWRFLVYLGKISFGIYLVHMFFLIYIIKYLMPSLSFECYFLNQLLLIFFTTTCSVALIYISRKINIQLVAKYLGF